MIKSLKWVASMGLVTILFGPGCSNAAPSNSSDTSANKGEVTTLAGSTKSGSNNGLGLTASFNYPQGVAVDASGTVYVADSSNNVIRKITPQGVVTTLAGSKASGSVDGVGPRASFNCPGGVAVDHSGNVYVADSSNHMIRKISAAGVVTTLAGSTTSGSMDGTGVAARFHYPTGVAVDPSGTVYVADYLNNKIRKITSGGVVTTLAGSAATGSADGTGASAFFHYPSGVAVDATGNIYVADSYNHMIRKITPAGQVTTLAGSTAGGFANGTERSASFSYPNGVAVDRYGDIYVADAGNNMIRKITRTGTVTTLAGTIISGSADGKGIAASFWSPSEVAVDATGVLYVADEQNNMIRKVN